MDWSLDFQHAFIILADNMQICWKIEFSCETSYLNRNRGFWQAGAAIRSAGRREAPAGHGCA
jgi:hypothetical protein